MRRDLLDILVAPGTASPLEVGDADASWSGSDLVSGELISAEGERFEVERSVPRMIPAAESSVTIDEGATQRSFGAKWAQYEEPEKDRLAEFQARWFDDRFGFSSELGLTEFLAGRSRVLDAGTGPGLTAARCARLSDARVVGMDLSESVFAARGRHDDQQNLDYVQGDILNPPFADRSFDFVIADQVLHHTPDCERAFQAMARLVADGGELAVYVYRRKAILRELADEHVRALTSQLSVDECMELSEQITELGRELSELDAKVTLKRGVPLLGIDPGEHDVQRLIYWAMLKCFWNEDLGWRQSVLVNFDWYSPVFASRHTPEEVAGWCDDADLEIVHTDVIESGISIRAVRPA